MKRDATFFNYLRENKIWLTEHKYETHALQSIGFIIKKSPNLTNRPQFEEDIGKALGDFMASALDEGDCNDVTIDRREFTPTLETSSKNVVHVLRDGDNKKIGVVETHALEIRCERGKADKLGRLLCAVDLPSNKFGTFIPYSMSKNDSDIYKKVIVDHNKFLLDIHVIPVFGLHPDVINTVVKGCSDLCDDNTFRNHLLDVEHSGGEGYELENTFLAVEPTQRTDDLGKWFLLTKKENEERANKFIDEFLIPNAIKTEAYANHLNDSDSYKSGICRTNKPSNYFTTYAEKLRNCVQIDDDSEDGNSNDNDKHNSKHKRRQILISFDDKEEFPSLPDGKRGKSQPQQRVNWAKTT